MAKKRMISNDVIGTARFLRLPLTAQALYMHLICRADDDGVVEAYSVLRITGNNEDDLRVLVAKEFVMILDRDDLIAYITDFLQQNTIRADRKVDSLYQGLLLKVFPDALHKKGRKILTELDCGQMETNAQSNDGQVSAECRHRTEQQQHRLEQYRTTTGEVGLKAVDYKSLLLLCIECGIGEDVVKKMIAEFGIERLQVQLNNLLQAKEVRNPMGWLRCALNYDYQNMQVGAAIEMQPMHRTIDCGKGYVEPLSLESEQYAEEQAEKYNRENRIIDPDFLRFAEKLAQGNKCEDMPLDK